MNLRHVSGCSATTCISYDSTAPETLTFTNSGLTTQTYYVVVSQISGTAFSLSFTLL